MCVLGSCVCVEGSRLASGEITLKPTKSGKTPRGQSPPPSPPHPFLHPSPPPGGGASGNLAKEKKLQKYLGNSGDSSSFGVTARVEHFTPADTIWTTVPTRADVVRLAKSRKSWRSPYNLWRKGNFVWIIQDTDQGGGFVTSRRFRAKVES